ncbi:MAG TPA: hypothetical protein VH111_10990 [Steroidobacteraceae bacterium]|jgi:hypothetical protein|nr:hypothetical protein [Steroidobacteraceae bacterium]
MSTEPGSPLTDLPERALDAALAHALRAPALPADFRTRLNALLGVTEIETREMAATRLEREYLAGLAELEAGYVRLRRRTVGLLLGGGIAAGAALPAILPWLQGLLGSYAPVALALLASAGGLGVAWYFPSRLTHLAEE